MVTNKKEWTKLPLHMRNVLGPITYFLQKGWNNNELMAYSEFVVISPEGYQMRRLTQKQECLSLSRMDGPHLVNMKKPKGKRIASWGHYSSDYTRESLDLHRLLLWSEMAKNLLLP